MGNTFSYILDRGSASLAVRLAIVLKEVGSEDFRAKSANEVIRMEFLAHSVHERTRDGRRATTTNGHSFLLQKVNLAVGQAFIIAESRSNGLGARLAGEAGAFLVEEASEGRNGLALNNFLAGAAHLSRSGAGLAISFSFAGNVLTIVESLATASAGEAIGVPFLSQRVDRNGEDSLTTAMAVDSSSGK